MNPYRNDPNFFLNYFTANCVVFTLLSATLWWLNPWGGWHWHFGIEFLALVPAGVIFGLVISTAFHNASHENIRPRWANTVVSEFTGAYTLEGMRNFRLGHMLHHAYSDDPDLDPHPPAGQTFVHFMRHSRARTIESLKTLYFKYHGETPASRRNIQAQLVVFQLSVAAKLAFWFLLLGPVWFVGFFVPSYLSYFLGFGHLNWISHLADADGVVRIKNHDGTPYYRIMNVITSGGYYHGNHHRAPRLYNPSKLR